MYLCLWLKSFLEGRTQQVRIREEQLFTALCPAAVPQGSVISPILLTFLSKMLKTNLKLT